MVKKYLNWIIEKMFIIDGNLKIIKLDIRRSTPAYWVFSANKKK